MGAVVEIALDYDSGVRPWGRLLGIGDVEIRYSHHLPVAIGERPIGYDRRNGGRLAFIGDRNVRHRIWMGTAKQLGDWRVRYWPVVPLLRQVGPFVVEHRGPWLRPSRVGPAALVYGPGRRHPEMVVVEPLTTRLDDDLVLAVAFALLEHLWRPSGG